MEKDRHYLRDSGGIRYNKRQKKNFYEPPNTIRTRVEKPGGRSTRQRLPSLRKFTFQVDPSCNDLPQGKKLPSLIKDLCFALEKQMNITYEGDANFRYFCLKMLERIKSRCCKLSKKFEEKRHKQLKETVKYFENKKKEDSEFFMKTKKIMVENVDNARNKSLEKSLNKMINELQNCTFNIPQSSDSALPPENSLTKALTFSEEFEDKLRNDQNDLLDKLMYYGNLAEETTKSRQRELVHSEFVQNIAALSTLKFKQLLFNI